MSPIFHLGVLTAPHLSEHVSSYAAAELKPQLGASLTRLGWAHSFPLSEPHCEDQEDSGGSPTPCHCHCRRG